MHRLTTDLIRKMADRLQAGKSAPSQMVSVWRQNSGNEFENMPFVLPEVTSISIDRRWNMAADELQIEMTNTNGFFSPDYSPLKDFAAVNSLPKSGFYNVLRPFNKIQCDLGFGDELIRVFTGQIQNVDILENPPSVSLNALNSYRKLLKIFDPLHSQKHIFSGRSALSIIKDLCVHAGIDNLIYDSHSAETLDFIIEKLTIPFGASYADTISKLVEPFNHRVTGGRYGELNLVRSIEYSQQDFHNWEFDDFINLTEGVYKFDSSVLKNRVIIMADNGWEAFEDPFLIDYCNGERISASIESPLALSHEQKWAVADSFFLNTRRRMRRLSVAVCGNPAMDVGDLVKMRMLVSTAVGKYMIIAIKSIFTQNGYIDRVDLEYVAGDNGHLCQSAEGIYSPDSISPEPGIPISSRDFLSLSLRDKIVDYAKSFLGRLYQWGGNFPESGYYGIDSSHLIFQVLCKFDLIDFYKTPYVLSTWCIPISRSDLLPGDLVFYNSGGDINHVAFYIGNGQIIGACGGDFKTTSIAIAESKNARVKILSLDYRPPVSFGRNPLL